MKNLYRCCTLLLGSTIALAAALFLSTLPSVRAQTPPNVIPVSLAPIQRDLPVELVSLTFDGDMSEANGHTLITGYSTFKLHNTDKLNDLQVPVGFPGYTGDSNAFDPARLVSFAVSVEGKKVNPTAARADTKLGSGIRAVDWYSFTIPLAADEKKTVRFDFQQDLGDGALPHFAYGLIPGAWWKGSIGSSRLTLRFPADTTPEQIIATDPSSAVFNGSSVTWNFATHEPLANPALTLLRPSLWADLANRRRAVQQNPNDASAHSALGLVLRQLAQLDSPRRDSYAGQAVAELETATRLDPNQRSARQALAAVYESRAGPASGPRLVAYVQLAVAQWETLAPTDAAARNQLAEDYFYLGMDAQTRGAFTDALAYFDKAGNLSPAGAGPLFTPDRAAAQRRILNVTWARALVDQGTFVDATARARVALGDAFITSFTPPPFYIASSQVTMTDRSRVMVYRLVPYAVQGEAFIKLANDASASLQAAGIDTSYSSQNGDIVFTISIPFGNETDLNKKLDAIAPALPNRPEWALVRAVAAPKLLVWEMQGGLTTNSTRYEEQVDLSYGCGAAQGQLDAIALAIKPVENAPASDQEAQLKRGLLKYAQTGWQRGLTQGQVSYRAGPTETVVEACAARTITSSAAPFRGEFWGLLIVLAGLVSLGIVLILWRQQAKRRKLYAERAGKHVAQVARTREHPGSDS